MASHPLSTSARIRTTQTLLSAYSALSATSLLVPLHNTFTHIVLPSSLSFPPRDRSSFASHAAGVTSIFSSFSITPNEIFEDEGKGIVIVRAVMRGVLKPGMGGGEGQGEKWENEIVMFLKFTDDGEKVTELVEFVDSWQSRKLQEKLMGGERGNVLIDDHAGKMDADGEEVKVEV